jgi:glycosyltransferase involved in cell wall biosynthesis
MNNTLVTIIVPAYKAEKYIGDALESISSQTYQNWEVIVVEDAWKDATERIVHQFSQKVGQDKVCFIQIYTKSD